MIAAADVFRVFAPHRGNAIVIPTGTSGRHWGDFRTQEKRDLTLGGAMGQTAAAALGFALGFPSEQVVLFDSEGALLMNLGILATIAGMQPQTSTTCCWTMSVMRRRAGSRCRTPRASTTLAWPNRPAIRPATASTVWRTLEGAWEYPQEKGPVFVAIKVMPEVENEPIGRRQRTPMRNRAETIRDLRQELGIA